MNLDFGVPPVAYGLAFFSGVISEKSKAYDPDVIRRQLKLQDYTPAKTFLSCALTETIALGLLNASGLDFYTDTQTLITQGLGGVIAGAGTYITASTPEAILTQIGSKKKRNEALMVAGGGVLGSICYAYAQPYLRRFILNLFPQASEMTKGAVSASLGQKVIGISFWKYAVPLSLILSSGLYLVEQLHPTTEKPRDTESDNRTIREILFQRRWNPYLCGMMLGLLKLPSYLLLGALPNVADSFQTFAGELMSSLFSRTPAYLKVEMTPAIMWKLFLSLGMISGAYLSSTYLRKPKSVEIIQMKELENKVEASLPRSDKVKKIMGGALMIFGSQLASTFSPVSLLSSFASSLLLTTIRS